MSERNFSFQSNTTIEDGSTAKRSLNRRTKARIAKAATGADPSATTQEAQAFYQRETPNDREGISATQKPMATSSETEAFRGGEPANEPVKDPANESVNPPANGSANKPTNHPASEPTSPGESDPMGSSAKLRTARLKPSAESDANGKTPPAAKPKRPASSEAPIFSAVPQDDNETPLKGLRRLTPYTSLLPAVLGLAFSRIGLLCGTYGNYASSDEGIFTDGSMFASLVLFAILLLALLLWRKHLSKAAVHMLTRVCIILECVSIFGLTVLQLHPSDSDFWRFSLSVICTFAACGAMFYWLRRMRGCASLTAAVFVFSALAVSEVFVYVGTLVPTVVEYSMAAILVLLQFPCQMWARRQQKPYMIEALTPESDYFGFSGNMIANVHFLIANAIGIACMGAVTGFLRGYPDGLPIPFTPLTRIAYGLLVIAISLTVITLVLHRRKNIMTIGFYLLLEIMACLALLMFSAFPTALDIGSVFATTLNALMVGFVWYITIAFMSSGWRDPYYYALAGWCVWLGSRSLARLALIAIEPLAADSLLICAIMGSLIVLSTQVTFVQFLRIDQKTAQQELNEASYEISSEVAQRETFETCAVPVCPAASGGVCVNASRREAESETPPEIDAPKEPLITRIMGLDGCATATPLPEASQRSLEQSAHLIGHQFMLSEREIEVLTLYARGFTQKRVAEALYISPGTAHAHIKRIYAKTGFHSRQEILDYMEEYAS